MLIKELVGLKTSKSELNETYIDPVVMFTMDVVKEFGKDYPDGTNKTMDAAKEMVADIKGSIRGTETGKFKHDVGEWSSVLKDVIELLYPDNPKSDLLANAASFVHADIDFDMSAPVKEDQKPMARIKDMICTSCGGHCRARQWFNQDIGYGLCTKCADNIKSHRAFGRDPMSSKDFEKTYGKEGVHYNIKESLSNDKEQDEEFPSPDQEGRHEADMSAYKSDTKSVSQVIEEWLLNNTDLLDGDYNDQITDTDGASVVNILNDFKRDFSEYVADHEEDRVDVYDAAQAFKNYQQIDLALLDELQRGKKISLDSLMNHLEYGVELLSKNFISFEQWFVDRY